MLNVILAVQVLAIAILLADLFYITYQRSSRMQVMLVIMVICTIVMLAGYSIELVSQTREMALLGVAIAYAGKPFALLMSLLFIADYCGVRIPRWISTIAALYGAAFPVLVFTNDYHYLYYSYVEFDRSRTFSPLTLGHGPLYYGYMVLVLVSFLATLYLIINEFHNNKTAKAKFQTMWIFSSLGASIAGYVIFLSGQTGGYDTTMAGAVIGSLILTMMFFRYKLFDSVSFAKDQAMDTSVNGIVVLGRNNRLEYRNKIARDLLELGRQSGLSGNDIDMTADGTSELHLGDKVYELTKRSVNQNGRYIGRTIEMTDVTEHYNYSARLEEEVARRTAELQHVQRSIIVSFAGIVEARDSSTGQHIKRLCHFACELAKELQQEGYFTDILTDEYISILTDIAPLHDIGKISIPDSILLKPGRLTTEEFDVIKTHTTHGARIIDECLRDVERPEYVEMAEQAALYHHEKWNGTGYPEQLSGDAIPLSARIIAVADVYDAIRSERCYKPAMSVEEASQVIAEGCGSHFDPVVAGAFLKLIPRLESEG